MKKNRNSYIIEEVFDPKESTNIPKIDELFEFYKDNKEKYNQLYENFKESIESKTQHIEKSIAFEIVTEIVDGFERSGSIEIFKSDIEKLKKLSKYIERFKNV